MINMRAWIDRDEALRRLGIKAQTLYAYVSRGRIRMEPDPADARRSLYSADDVAQLTARHARGRGRASIAASSMAWGEPAIPTSLSAIHRGRPHYRGRDAIELAASGTLEETAALLWDCAAGVAFAAPAQVSGHVYATLAAMIPASRPIVGRGRDALVSDGAAIVGAIAAECGAAGGDGPLHVRMARGLGCDAAHADRIRQTLVAMADHDLNASTFAVRVAASTGASLPAAVLTGACALSGPRHGGATAALRRLLADARAEGCAAAIDRWLDRGLETPGFGHPLYPDGDPREGLITAGLELGPFLTEFRDAVTARTGMPPNCDFGLVAMSEVLGLPSDAPLSIFLTGRSVGWIAHAMEQNRSGTLIRPRGRYEGPPLQGQHPA